MGETIDQVISDRLEVLSRSIFPVNYVFSKTYEYATNHRACAFTITTKTGAQVDFTKPVKVHPKLLEQEGPFAYRRRLYYVKELKILDSHLIITHDELDLPKGKTPKENVGLFVQAIKPYLNMVDSIIRKRFATIVIRISSRSQPLFLHRQAVKGKQTLTITELLAEMNVPMEIRNTIKQIMFRSKPGPIPDEKKKSKQKVPDVSASFFTLEDGRIILPTEGSIQAQEFIELGKIPYRFEKVEGPVPSRQIITSFLELANKTVAQLLEEYSELAFLPFFFDLYLEQSGPPIRNVALLDGQLIIGRTPESNIKEGEFEVFLAKSSIEKLRHK